jgi:integrase
VKKAKNSIKILVRGKAQMLSLVLPQIYCGKRTNMALNIASSVEHLKYAEFKARQMEMDFLSGHFDVSLEKYKPINIVAIAPSHLLKTTFSGIYQSYIDSRKKNVSPTTWKGTYANTVNHLNDCPYKLPSEALQFKDWLIANRTLDTARRVLMQINAACNWAAERNLIQINPFAGKAKIKGKKSKPQIHPFSNAEKTAILDAFAKSEKFRYLTPLIKFFFLTGCRTSEAIALQWKHIKSDCSVISFEETIVLGKGGAQRKKGTKQSPQRSFPCNRQLQQLLVSLKPDEKVIANSSVFVRPDSLPVSHQDLRTAWYGKGSTQGIVRQLAADGAVEGYRPQYNTRHTMISACLEAGISPVQIAHWVGNSAEIIFRNYAGLINKIQVPEF